MFCVLALLVVWASMLRGFDISQCIAPLGMESGQIPDRDITASSCFNDRTVGSYSARLNQDIKGGAWCPNATATSEPNQWLEIDLRLIHVITATSIQGRFGNGVGKEYAENYFIEYWRPKLDKWVRYHTSDDKEVLPGNFNTYLVRTNTMDSPVWASKIRFVPISSNHRTVCMRVEVYGCYWAAGIVAYSIYKGDKRSNGIELTDITYDGEWGDVLKGGLGQLVDGVFGGDEIREAAKHSAWIGWRKDSTPYPFILFEFDKVREFKAVHIFCSNKFMRDVQIFSEAVISFSIGGRHFQDEPIHYSNIPDKIFEHSRNVSIKLHHRIGRWVRIELKYSARWILISEVMFDSEIAQGHHNPENQKPDIKEKTKRPPKKLDLIPTPTEDTEVDTVSMVIIMVVLTTLVVVLVAAVALFVHRHRHRKCFASPVIRSTAQTRDSYGGCSTSILNNKRALELPTDVKSDDYQEPYHESNRNDRASVVLEMQEFKDSHPGNCSTYGEPSHYEYAVPEPSSAPLLPRRGMPVPDRLISNANRIEMETRLAQASDSSGSTHSTIPENIRNFLGCNRLPEFPRHRLRLISKLCEGNYGNLVYIADANRVPDYSGEVTPEQRFVAVRFLTSNNPREDFDRDAAIVATLSSPYISRVIGICRSPPFAVIMEYLEHGDLCSYLRTKAPPSPDMLLHMAEQIAAGMEYLETVNFVHRDLAARNILIGKAYQIKICDFGIDNDLFSCDYYEVIGRVPLPLRWASWETVLKGKYTMKSDVWSFGVVVYELYTLCRRPPYYHFSDEEVIKNLNRMADDSNLFEPLPRCAAPYDVYLLMQECWRRNDAERPTFAKIHSFFNKKLDERHYAS